MKRLLLIMGLSILSERAIAATIPPITVTPAKSTVFVINQSTGLWYFNGISPTPANYNTSISVNAVGPNQGAFTWTVTSGANVATLENNSSTLTGPDPAVGVNSVGASVLPNDVGIDFQYNGNDVGTFHLSVLTPASSPQIDPLTGRVVGPESIANMAIQVYVPGTSVLYQEGFESDATFQFLDQFSNPVPYALPANESFGTFVARYPSTNWASGVPASAVATSITDHWSVVQTFPFLEGSVPEPSIPLSPLGITLVFEQPQTYSVGTLTTGAGIPVENHTLQFYQDHATYFK